MKVVKTQTIEKKKKEINKKKIPKNNCGAEKGANK
jgi:hypothetical protein